jgi:Flp pilus assembly protein TadD
MQRPPTELIKGDVARELCRRAGAAAVVQGSIASFGAGYDLRLDVRRCTTGKTLATEQARASGKDDVLGALSTAALTLRRRLGEPADSLQQRAVPIPAASTTSLPALRALAEGNRTRFTRGDQASIPFFVQATSLDPSFALAYAKLGVVNGNLGQLEAARTYAQKAFDLKDRATEYERLLIVWNQAARAADPARSRAALEQLTTTFPRDFAARNNFGVYYMGRGEFEEALKQYQAATAIAADEPVPLSNSAYALFFLGRRDEAYAMVDRAFAIRPDPNLAIARWTAAAIAGDPRAAEFETAAGNLATPEQLAQARASLALYRGRLAEYRQIQASLRTAAREANNDETLARIDGAERRALAALERGPSVDALAASVERQQPADVLAQSAAMLASLGELNAARSALARLDRAAPPAAPAGPVRVARAYLRAADGHGDEAIADLQAFLNESPQDLELNFHIGSIRERLGDVKGAEASYRALLASINALGPNPSIAAARLALAAIRAKQGDTAGAREPLDALLSQWKDADTEFALLKQARAARAALK